MPIRRARKTAYIYLSFAALNLLTIALSLSMSERMYSAFGSQIGRDRQLADGVAKLDALEQTAQDLDTPLTAFTGEDLARLRASFTQGCSSFEQSLARERNGFTLGAEAASQLTRAQHDVAGLKRDGLLLLDAFGDGRVRDAERLVP